MAPTDLLLRGQDGHSFKDGRGWYSSETRRAGTLDWPFPSTVLGALRTGWGRSLEASDPSLSLDRRSWPERTAEVALHAMLPLRRRADGSAWSRADRMWPVPLDALYARGAESIERLCPRPATVPSMGRDLGSDEEQRARERLWRPRRRCAEKPVPAPRWWPDPDFEAWLRGEEVAAHRPADYVALTQGNRSRVHVSLDAETGTAREGALFSLDVVEPWSRCASGAPLWEWAMALRASFPEDTAGIASQPLFLGGDGGLTHAGACPAGLLAAPDFQDRPCPGLRLVLVTPACFERGWLPDGFDATEEETFEGQLSGIDGTLVLRAAITGRALHVSGWDVARGEPKPTLRLVPPGSVYFFQKKSAEPITAAELQSLWLGQIGGHTTKGMGCVAGGVWHPEGTSAAASKGDVTTC